MHRHALFATFSAFVVLLSGAAAGALAQETAEERPAEIRLGACTGAGDVVAPLSNLIMPSGELLGQAGAMPAAQSVSLVPVPLASFLASSHLVVVYASPQESDVPVACGEIGGAVADDGTLAVGLNAMNGAKISGAAYFAPTPEGDGTTVTLLLIDERAGRRGEDGTGDAAEPAAADTPGADTAAVGGPSTVDDASGVDNAMAPAPAPAPAPATAGLDGVSTISATNEDGKNAKPDRNTDKAKADRDANGNAGNATTDSASSDGTGNRERDADRGEREGGARAGEDGGANG